MIFHQKRDNKEQHVLELKMTFIWEDIESKETKSIRWYGLGVDAQEKCFGKALTYSLKYFYINQFDLPTPESDPDTYDNDYKNDKQNELIVFTNGKFAGKKVSEVSDYSYLQWALNTFSDDKVKLEIKNRMEDLELDELNKDNTRKEV